MKKIRILSIDGGGLRGIAPLLILKEIEKQQGKRIHELFDVIIGTSTGGIIASGLTCTKDNINPYYTIDQLIEIYTTKSNMIFPLDNNIFTKTYRKVKTLFSPMYSSSGISKLLYEYFSDMKLSNTLIPIIVTSYDIKNNEVVMFKTRNAKISQQHDAYLKDICRATSAAPVYFPSYNLNYNNKDRILVDGGVYINNPTMAGVSDILKTINVSIDNVEVLSLGTGMYSKSLSIKTRKWGILEWVQSIITIMMQASSKAVVYESDELLKKHLRLQFSINNKKYSNMADASKETRNYIIEETKKQLLNSETISKINNFFI